MILGVISRFFGVILLFGRDLKVILDVFGVISGFLGGDLGILGVIWGFSADLGGFEGIRWSFRCEFGGDLGIFEFFVDLGVIVGACLSARSSLAQH